MRALAFLAAALLAACSRAPSPDGPLRVAAASDLVFALPELAAAFEAEDRIRPQITFGSTGLLARQIAQGAPFDLFAAADVSFADEVARAGACDAATKAVYARGRLVLWTPQGLEPPASLEALAAPRFKKIALANPEHAPYGRAARQALRALPAWSAIGPKLVFGDNVQQALQYARSGNADAALIAASLAPLARGGSLLEIDERHHAPLDQALIVCRRGRARAAAVRFAALITSQRGRTILRRHRFSIPGEPAPPDAGAGAR